MENIISNGQGNSQIWSEYYNLPKSLSNSPEKFAEFYQRASHNANKKLDHKLFQGLDPKKDGFIRFVVISDTHNRQPIVTQIPDGDVLLHCGDVTLRSMKKEFVSFNKWIGSLPHPTKIVIAGNHDRLLEIRPLNNFFQTLGAADREELMQEFTNFTYLEDESINVHGYKIYGSPWTPVHLGGFQKQRGVSIRSKWDMIPSDTDILLTHGPPATIGDYTKRGDYAGCVDLLEQVQTRIQPIYHCFGHIHESNGVYSDGTTTYINAAICDISYKARQPAYVFDLPVRSSDDKLKCTSSENDNKPECGSSSETENKPECGSSSETENKVECGSSSETEDKVECGSSSGTENKVECGSST